MVATVAASPWFQAIRARLERADALELENERLRSVLEEHAKCRPTPREIDWLSEAVADLERDGLGLALLSRLDPEAAEAKSLELQGRVR